MEQRGKFASNFGAVMAAAGSAVGLGNIWRFPYEAGQYGGLAFILVYILCVVALGIPLMSAEFVIGRHSRSGPVRMYKTLAPRTPWKFIGYMNILTAVLILSYYSVVSGWCLQFVQRTLVGGAADQIGQNFATEFYRFSQNPVEPVIWMIAFLIITHIIIVCGVEKGIERFSKFIMPVFFVFILFLVGCSITLPNSFQGVEFMFRPDFGQITPKLILAALGQAFFSLSLGMGCMSTYASYFDKKDNLTKSAVQVSLIDTGVAILSGLMIFPAAFSAGIKPDSGPSLVFITLPGIFQQCFGSSPVLIYFLSLVFFCLLTVAALTSTISLHEIGTSFFQEEFHLKRGIAATIMTVVCIILGTFCSLSIGDWRNITLFGLGFFDLFDYVVTKILLPIGGIAIVTFVGWYFDKQKTAEELSTNGTISTAYFKLLIFVLKWPAPIAIAAILLAEIGIF